MHFNKCLLYILIFDGRVRLIENQMFKKKLFEMFLSTIRKLSINLIFLNSSKIKIDCLKSQSYNLTRVSTDFNESIKVMYLVERVNSRNTFFLLYHPKWAKAPIFTLSKFYLNFPPLCLFHLVFREFRFSISNMVETSVLTLVKL